MRAIAAALLVLVAGIALAACGGSTDKAAGPPSAPTTTAESQPSVPDRERAPALQGKTLDGEAISLGDFQGRPVLVNVWSSW